MFGVLARIMAGWFVLVLQLGLAVSSATPPLMMSMLLAISIDYALFLLTRFKEEVEAGNDIDAWPTLEDFLLFCGFLVISWPFLGSGGVLK